MHRTVLVLKDRERADAFPSFPIPFLLFLVSFQTADLSKERLGLFLLLLGGGSGERCELTKGFSSVKAGRPSFPPFLPPSPPPYPSPHVQQAVAVQRGRVQVPPSDVEVRQEEEGVHRVAAPVGLFFGYVSDKSISIS